MALNFKHDADRIYAEDGGGQILAQITFPAISDDTVDITGTYVDPSLRGQGIADSLIRAAIAYARERGLKVVLTCPFAKKWFSAHPEFFYLLDAHA